MADRLPIRADSGILASKAIVEELFQKPMMEYQKGEIERDFSSVLLKRRNHSGSWRSSWSGELLGETGQVLDQQAK